MSTSFPSPASYKNRWTRWGGADPVADAYGVTFYKGPAGDIVAPSGFIRVCAYHVDWDEAPTCALDVQTVAEAKHVADHFAKASGSWNVDFVTCYDEHGRIVGSTCPWAGTAFDG